ncbi:MAG: hypothetical protein ACRDNS_23615 [Trebonia sp.]
MGLLRAPASWLLSIADRFPVAVQPGIYLALLILLVWALTRARRPIYNAALRVACLAADLVIGLLLLPEYAFTRAQRAAGGAPGPLMLAVGRAVERVLDGAADLYAAHPLVRIAKRPPLVLIVLLIAVSYLDYWLLHQAPPNTAIKVSHNIWSAWVQFATWTRGS